VAQPAHVDINEIGFRNEFVMPHVFKQRGTFQQLTIVLHHVSEQAKFLRQQSYRAFPTPGGSLDEVEMQRSDLQFNSRNSVWRCTSSSSLARRSAISSGSMAVPVRTGSGSMNLPSLSSRKFHALVAGAALARRETSSDAGEMPSMLNECILSLLILFLANSAARAADDQVDAAI
jgi:hypothetical protein